MPRYTKLSFDHKTWLETTSRVAIRRSPKLKQLDAAIKDYALAQEETNYDQLCSAFEAWKKGKGAHEEWKRSCRNVIKPNFPEGIAVKLHEDLVSMNGFGLSMPQQNISNIVVPSSTSQQPIQQIQPIQNSPQATKPKIPEIRTKGDIFFEADVNGHEHKVAIQPYTMACIPTLLAFLYTLYYPFSDLQTVLHKKFLKLSPHQNWDTQGVSGGEDLKKFLKQAGVIFNMLPSTFAANEVDSSKRIFAIAGIKWRLNSARHFVGVIDRAPNGDYIVVDPGWGVNRVRCEGGVPATTYMTRAYGGATDFFDAEFERDIFVIKGMNA